jgi:hypothetical protein
MCKINGSAVFGELFAVTHRSVGVVAMGNRCGTCGTIYFSWEPRMGGGGGGRGCLESFRSHPDPPLSRGARWRPTFSGQWTLQRCEDSFRTAFQERQIQGTYGTLHTCRCENCLAVIKIGKYKI